MLLFLWPFDPCSFRKKCDRFNIFPQHSPEVPYSAFQLQRFSRSVNHNTVVAIHELPLRYLRCLWLIKKENPCK
jgi:hypothetical protein